MELAADFAAQVEDLEANIDDLEDALHPLLTTPLHTFASTLPLLDKAKIYIHMSYAIESLIYNALQAAGEDAKEHPVWSEIARIRTYFKKIKDAELGPEPKARLDKDAAARFIKHGLAGNARYDLERAERMAKEKAKAGLKAKGRHTKFDQEEEDRRMESLPKGRVTEGVEVEDDDEGENDVDSENEEFYGREGAGATQKQVHKKQTVSASELNEAPVSNQGKRDRKTKERKGSKLERRERKEQRRRERARATGEHQRAEETILPAKAPQTHSETFNALLDGSFSSKTKDKKGM